MSEYSEAEETERTTAAERYLELAAKRDRYLTRARECSKFTIPALIPENDDDMGEDEETPAQSDGAKCINSLSAKILLAMVPPNIPVFRLETNDVANVIMSSQDPQLAQAAQEIRENLDRIPRAALLLTETYRHRPTIFEGIKHLIAGGNVLFWMMSDKAHLGEIRSVPLSRYVVLRDSLGFPLEIIIKDGLSAANLPPKLKEILHTKKSLEDILKEASTVKSDSTTSDYSLYTYSCWDPATKKYNVHQEFMGEEVDGTKARYTSDDFPFVALRFSSSDGKDYGRGLVEEYLGVLMSLEAIAQAETALAIIMAEIRWMVGAASGIRARDLQNSPPGAHIDAEPDTIKALTADKYGDLAAMLNTKQALQRDLGLAFLVETAIQRSGERVTAEEIRTMMQLLDSTLGGLYSALSADFQAPYVRFQLRLLKKQQGIDIGKSGAVRPRIVTGLEALGQSSEAQQFFQSQKVLSDLVGPAVYGQRVHVDALAKKINGYFNVEAAGIYKTQEEVQQEQAANQQAETNKAAVGPIVNAVGKAATQQ